MCSEKKNNVIYLNPLNDITLQLVQYSKYSLKGTSWKSSFALFIFFLGVADISMEFPRIDI